MARPPANKPATTDGAKPTEAFVLPAPIKDPMQELMFLLGHLRGKIVTADRIAELVLILQAQANEKIEQAFAEGREGK